jgi:N-acetylglucosaminyl-diphospho-decaprenol L-rhamnosyltransferase
MAGSPRVDAVVVAYNSARTLRACVEPLAAMPAVAVTVVDNASPDDTEAAIAGVDAALVRAESNGGFAAGCNLGAAGGSADYVLLLNPDARVAEADLMKLVAVLDARPDAALAAPRILEDDGSLAYSLRRFPRRRSTFAQALFLHRLWPRAAWTDESVRDPAVYAAPGSPEWVSGACMLVRRSALEAIGGFDEGFFLYCEDTDLCRRLSDAGWGVCFEPAAVARHEGGVSAPRTSLQAVLAASRVRYARKHSSRGSAALETVVIALHELTHTLVNLPRASKARGHARALRAVVSPSRSPEVVV